MAETNANLTGNFRFPTAKWIMTKRVEAPKPKGRDAKAKLAALVHETSGVNHMHAPATALISAAEQFATREGAEAASFALAALNEDREAMGIVPACPPAASNPSK